MRMAFEFEDGESVVIAGVDEAMCFSDACEITEQHGRIVFYSEIEDDSILYGSDGGND